jgi:integrase
VARRLRSGSTGEVTAAKAYRLLRQILQAAADDRLIRDNPCRIKGAAIERSRERRTPSLAEVQRLAELITPSLRAAVLLASFAGLRRGECLGLARRHLHRDDVPPTVTVERSLVCSMVASKACFRGR